MLILNNKSVHNRKRDGRKCILVAFYNNHLSGEIEVQTMSFYFFGLIHNIIYIVCYIIYIPYIIHLHSRTTRSDSWERSVVLYTYSVNKSMSIEHLVYCIMKDVAKHRCHVWLWLINYMILTTCSSYSHTVLYCTSTWVIYSIIHLTVKTDCNFFFPFEPYTSVFGLQIIRYLMQIY